MYYLQKIIWMQYLSPTASEYFVYAVYRDHTPHSTVSMDSVLLI